jgi:hypothetical protein
LPLGDNRKIYNKNYDNACEKMESNTEGEVQIDEANLVKKDSQNQSGELNGEFCETTLCLLLAPSLLNNEN